MRLSIFLCLLCSIPLLGADGIQVNGDFERGDNLGWTEWKSPWGSNFNYNYAEPDAYEGNSALKLSAASGSFGVYQEFCVEPGVPFVVSWAWKGSSSGNGWWEVLALDAPFTYELADLSPGNFILAKWEQGFGGLYPEPSADWTEGEETMTPTSEVVALVLKCGSSEGGLVEASFDNVIVTQDSQLLEITEISPSKVPTAGGTEVVISGRNIPPDAVITIAGTELLNPLRFSACGISGTVPPGEAGPAQVVLDSSLGSVAFAGTFLYVGPPEIQSMDPGVGPVEGGTQVTIHGLNFEDLDDLQVDVRLAGTPMINAILVNSTTITGETPPGAAGPADLTITTPFGQAILSGGFTYETTEPVFLRGDSDTNGKLELTDVIKALNFQFLGNATLDCPDAADVDDDGMVTLTDAIRSLNYQFVGAAGTVPAPPGPFQCGPDVYEDELPPCVYPVESCPEDSA